MDLSNSRDRLIALVVIVAISIFGLLLDSIGVIGSLYDVSAAVGLPIRFELRKVSLQINDFLGAISKITDLEEENNVLREENIRLQEELAGFDECRIEQGRLREQLGILDTVETEKIQARVIGADVALQSTIQLNVGRSDGVSEGDVVTFGSYAVGEVKRVEKYSSTVLLITAPTSNVPARGQENRSIGLVAGDVGLTLKMVDILLDEEIEVGETIVTSGVDSNFPAGFIVGKVSAVEDNPAYATKEADVEVQIDFTRLDYVYVIQGQMQ